MFKLLFKPIVFIAAVFITDWLLPGVGIKTFEAGLIVAAILVAINTFIKPIIRLFTFPITLLTLGLFPLALNTVIILIVAYFVNGFTLNAYYTLTKVFWAFEFGLVLTIVNLVLDKASKMLRKK